MVLLLGVLQRSGGGGGPGSYRAVRVHDEEDTEEIKYLRKPVSKLMCAEFSVHDEEDTEEIKYLRKPVSKLMCAECVLSSLYCVHTTTA